jgi:hypothetical protein
MTEERARHYAEALSHSMGVTFYVVRSREGRFLTVQIPSDNCEVFATVCRRTARTKTRNFFANKSGRLLKKAAFERLGRP